ncbi:MAG: carbamate kinase [Caldilineaceae bacterium]
MEPERPERSPLAVIAIGGNSLIKDSHHPEVKHQWDAVRETAGNIANLIQSGWRAVITHGNGPQAGYILQRNELSIPKVHTTPMDLIVADTQGSIGYMLQQALSNEFYQRKMALRCVTCVTQTLVDRHDTAFAHPTKPIGGFLDEEGARDFEAAGWSVVEDAGRGWRRVIASPEPLAFIEEQAIRDAVAAGWVVIAAGGGGIPVIRNRKGELRGVTAVIDKDLASGLLAAHLQADIFLISTTVEQVALNYGKPDERPLSTLSVSQARSYMGEGHFAPGSMQPKIEACVRFLLATDNHDAACVITSPDKLEMAAYGNAGTRIMRDPQTEF